MKKIVLIRSNSINPDPPVEKMADALLELGHSVTVIGWDRSSNYNQKIEFRDYKHGTIKVVLFGIRASFGGGLKRNLIPLIKFQYRLDRWLRKNRNEYDAIHAFDFDTGLISSIHSKKNNKKFIYHILDYYVDCHAFRNKMLKKIIRNKENNVINNADVTIICTERRIKQIQGSYPRKLYVIHNTPDQSFHTENQKIIKTSSQKKMKIAYVGILATTRKLKEIADIVRKNDKYEFHIGGFGALEEYFKEMDSKYENIHFYGKLPYEDTLQLEQECDIMVAIYDPSIRNNQYSAPNKFYEALMIGRPIIMAKGTGFDEVINSNSIGVMVDYTNESIKKGLFDLYQKKEQWELISRTEKDLYKDSYSWEMMKLRIYELYSNIW